MSPIVICGLPSSTIRLTHYPKKRHDLGGNLLLLLLALQPTVGFSLLSDFLPFRPFFHINP